MTSGASLRVVDGILRMTIYDGFVETHCVKSLEHDVRNEGRMSYFGNNYDEIMRVSCLQHNDSSNVRLRQQYRENMVRKVV